MVRSGPSSLSAAASGLRRQVDRTAIGQLQRVLTRKEVSYARVLAGLDAAAEARRDEVEKEPVEEEEAVVVQVLLYKLLNHTHQQNQD